MTLAKHRQQLLEKLRQAEQALQQTARAVEQLRGALAFCDGLLAEEPSDVPDE